MPGGFCTVPAIPDPARAPGSVQAGHPVPDGAGHLFVNLEDKSQTLSIDTKALKIDTSDEVVKGTLVTQNGQIVHPSLSQN